MKRCSLLLLSFLFLLCNCNSSTPEAKEIAADSLSASPANRIVLLFDGCIEHAWYTWPNGSKSGFAPPFEVRYLDDHHITRYFIPRYAPGKDTLVISTTRPTIEVQHAFRGMEKLSYLFKNGDSVLFTYHDSLPYATVLNRQVAPEEVNYELMKREQLLEGRLPGLVRMEARFAFKDSSFAQINEVHDRIETAVAVGREAAAREYHKELKWLNTLEQQEVISANARSFYQQKAAYDASELYITPYDYRNKKVGSYPAMLMPTVEGEPPIPTMEELLSNSPDSLGANFHYQQLLDNYLRAYFWPKADWVIKPNSKLRDYRQVYDSVRVSNKISQSIKKQFLFKTMDALAESSSARDLDKYWQKFQQDVPDTAFTNYIREKYQLHKKLNNELELLTLNSQKINLSAVLQQHQGKVVYVDFWASWCGPCLKVLPASQKLQEEYKGKDVVFVFLSLDEDKAKWKTAAAKHKLQNNSYLIANRHTSATMDELNVESIPRYLIYNKEGKLVHMQAAGPGGTEIRKELDKYLLR